MAQVVLLRGVNVGGYRNFRPAMLADELGHLGAVNVGAAGTFVITRPISRSKLREEFTRRLPFDADIVICRSAEISRLITADAFATEPERAGIVRFVSVLTGNPRSSPSLPMSLPARGRWLLKILRRENRFVFGVYRRHMKVIGYLGSLDRLFGVRVTTRNWNTIAAIADVLNERA